jgi:hypothetical protein
MDNARGQGRLGVARRLEQGKAHARLAISWLRGHVLRPTKGLRANEHRTQKDGFDKSPTQAPLAIGHLRRHKSEDRLCCLPLTIFRPPDANLRFLCLELNLRRAWVSEAIRSASHLVQHSASHIALCSLCCLGVATATRRLLRSKFNVHPSSVAVTLTRHLLPLRRMESSVCEVGLQSSSLPRFLLSAPRSFSTFPIDAAHLSFTIPSSRIQSA